jgi:hypothetical protein
MLDYLSIQNSIIIWMLCTQKKLKSIFFAQKIFCPPKSKNLAQTYIVKYFYKKFRTKQSNYDFNLFKEWNTNFFTVKYFYRFNFNYHCFKFQNLRRRLFRKFSISWINFHFFRNVLIDLSKSEIFKWKKWFQYIKFKKSDKI